MIRVLRLSALAMAVIAAPLPAQTLGPLPATNLPGYSYVLAKSATAASITGTVTETTLGTFTIPAGAIGPNGQVEIYTLWSVTGSTNSKTLRVNFGASSVASLPIVAAAGMSAQIFTRVANRNSASSQVAFTPAATGIGQGAAANAFTSINTANAVVVNITGQLANMGETITLESYSIRIIYGA